MPAIRAYKFAHAQAVGSLISVFPAGFPAADTVSFPPVIRTTVNTIHDESNYFKLFLRN